MSCNCEGVDNSTEEIHIIAWTAWFDGGRRFRSSDIGWKDLPVDGMLGWVLCESKRVPSGFTKQFYSGFDMYFHDGQQLYGGNNDRIEETQSRYPNCVIKRGKWTTVAEMHRVNQEMLLETFEWVNHG